MAVLFLEIYWTNAVCPDDFGPQECLHVACAKGRMATPLSGRWWNKWMGSSSAHQQNNMQTSILIYSKQCITLHVAQKLAKPGGCQRPQRKITLLRAIPTVTLLCHSFWQLIWKYTWHIFSDILFWHSFLTFYSGILFWHSIWHLFWHPIWHPFWHQFWHIFSGILSGILSDHLSIWHLFWNSSRHLFWHFIWHSTWQSILAFYLASILTCCSAMLSDILSGIWLCIWHIFWHSFWHSIWYIFGDSLWLRSGGEHSDPELWSGACGGGPAGNTLILRLLFGSSWDHCDLELAVEVRRRRRRRQDSWHKI